MMVSDVMLKEELPPAVRRSAKLWAGCTAGALVMEDSIAAVREAGFTSVEVRSERGSTELLTEEEKTSLREQAQDLSPAEIERLSTAVISAAVHALR